MATSSGQSRWCKLHRKSDGRTDWRGYLSVKTKKLRLHHPEVLVGEGATHRYLTHNAGKQCLKRILDLMEHGLKVGRVDAGRSGDSSIKTK